MSSTLASSVIAVPGPSGASGRQPASPRLPLVLPASRDAVARVLETVSRADHVAGEAERAALRLRAEARARAQAGPAPGAATVREVGSGVRVAVLAVQRSHDVVNAMDTTALVRNAAARAAERLPARGAGAVDPDEAMYVLAQEARDLAEQEIATSGEVPWTATGFVETYIELNRQTAMTPEALAAELKQRARSRSERRYLAALLKHAPPRALAIKEYLRRRYPSRPLPEARSHHTRFYAMMSFIHYYRHRLRDDDLMVQKECLDGSGPCWAPSVALVEALATMRFSGRTWEQEMDIDALPEEERPLLGETPTYDYDQVILEAKRCEAKEQALEAQERRVEEAVAATQEVLARLAALEQENPPPPLQERVVLTNLDIQL